MYKKKTLRRMPAVTRRYARIINDLDSVTRRLKNLTDDISRLEFDSAALQTATRQDPQHANLDESMEDYFNQEEAANGL
ncbi:MAG: hypothetical protein R6V59_06310 [Dehalococcoidia bacterium]